MWQFVRVVAKDPIKVGAYLKDGYEPFAVSVDKYDQETVWLRKETDEIPSEPEKLKPGTSRKSPARK